MSETSRLNVQDVTDKISLDRVLSAVEYPNTEHNVSYAGEFVLAIDMLKDAAITQLITTLKEAAFNVVSVASNVFLADGPDIHIEVRGYQRSKYSTLYVRLWTQEDEIRKEFDAWCKKVFNGKLIKGTICGLRWAYKGAHGMATTYIEELISDTVLDEAYPEVIRRFGSLKAFAQQYFASDESVLLLQGPPGTGKSRLIRYLMGQLVNTKNIDSQYDESFADRAASGKSLVLYTSDTDSLKGDELFANFMVNDEVMFVVEDADNMLRSRQNGNDDLHRFLTVSDGIIRNVGRKVIFTTNLPNVKDVDDALVRPGRCFAALSLGGMNQEEAVILIEKLSGNRKEAVEAVLNHFKANKMMTVAEVYKAWKSLPK